MIRDTIKRVLRRIRPQPAPPAAPPPAPVPVPDNGYEKRVYIYTIPKSGTYLWGILLEELGLINSGYHLSVWAYLDTLAHDADTNSRTPSKTRVEQVYLHTVNKLHPGHFCFGHLTPMYFPHGLVRDRYRFLCTRRNPRETVVSEFIDFRYRRDDVRWVSEEKIEDPQKAFERYLKRHGPVAREICLQFLSLRGLRQNEHFQMMSGTDTFFEVDFKSFLKPEQGPGITRDIAEFLGVGLEGRSEQDIWRSVLEKDNKTKSAGLVLPFDKADLWTPKAERLFAELELDRIAADLGY